MNAPPSLNGTLAGGSRQPHDDGITILVDDTSKRRGSRSSFIAKCKTYHTGHFLSTGPSFSSLASNGSTIVLSRNASYYIEEDDENEGDCNGQGLCESQVFEGDQECVVPLRGGGDSTDGWNYGEGADGGAAAQGIGRMRRVPRTDSYYRRAGLTNRLDDMHFLANAPSFSSFATTATNVTDARLGSSMANISFASRQSVCSGSRNGLSAAVSMACTSNAIRSYDPRFSLIKSQSAPGIGNNATPPNIASSAVPNSSLAAGGAVGGPRGTTNIFLQQDDAGYQSLLTSIATSNSIAMAPVAATNRAQGSAPPNNTCIPSSSAGSVSGSMGLHRSKSSTRRLSEEGRANGLATSTTSIGRRNASRTGSGSMRRSNSSAVSILRRGRYSSGFLGSVKEDQEHNFRDNNNHNASFNNNNNSVKFTAPTIHLIANNNNQNQKFPSPRQDQHLDDKEQTEENADTFRDDEKIPACVLAAFAGGSPMSESRRSSECSSLSSPGSNGHKAGAIKTEPDNKKTNDKSIDDYQERPTPDKKRENDGKATEEKKSHIPREVTAIGTYYEDDELDEYLFTGMQSLHMDGDDNAQPAAATETETSEAAGISSRRSGLASSGPCSAARSSMSSLSTMESKRSTV